MKSYLTYTHTSTFGLITNGPCTYIPSHASPTAIKTPQAIYTLKGLPYTTSNNNNNNNTQHEETKRGELRNCTLLHGVYTGFADGSLERQSTNTTNETEKIRIHKAGITCIVTIEDAEIIVGSEDTTLTHVRDMELVTRYKGHTGAITQVEYMKSRKLVFSTGKDKTVRIWELDGVQIATMNMNGTCWGIQMLNLFARGFSNTSSDKAEVAEDDDEQVIKIEDNEEADSHVVIAAQNTINIYKINHSNIGQININPETLQSDPILEAFATLKRQTQCTARIIKLQVYERYILIAADKTLEVYKIRSAEESAKKIKRRKKRLREKKLDDSVLENDIDDYIAAVTSIRMSAKIRNFDASTINMEVQILLSLADNSIHTYILPENAKSLNAGILINYSHGTDIRAMALSHDDEMLLSCSEDIYKIWNTRTQTPIRTLEGVSPKACIFLPGDEYVLVLALNGTLNLYSVASAALISSIPAHTKGASLCLRPNGLGIMSGGDLDVKFWDFYMDEDKLKLEHMRTLKMSDDVTCVRYSPDGKLVCVAMIDCCVKVFFNDTLAFYLNLYGHRLPVTDLAVAEDNAKITTVSGDKNIKVWGLDFGDCHRSIFAHSEQLTCVRYVPRTHYFWTAGSGGDLKEWDGDKFENIQSFQDHNGSISSLAVSSTGSMVATAGHDRSIRFYTRTMEPLFLEEQKELAEEAIQLEELAQDGIAKESVIFTEKIADILQLDLPEETLRVCERVNFSVLEQGIVNLKLTDAHQLQKHAEYWLQQKWNLPLTFRLFDRMVKTFWPHLDLSGDISALSRARANEMKDLVSFNCAGLGMILRTIKEREITFDEDEDMNVEEIVVGKKKKSKKRRGLVVLDPDELNTETL